MVAAIESFTNRHGFVRAYLGVRKEQKILEGKTSKWVVPYLRMDETVDQVLAGGGAVAAIATRSATPADLVDTGSDPGDAQAEHEQAAAMTGEEWADAELAAAEAATCSLDDEVVDAEVVTTNDTTQPLGRVAKKMGLDDEDLQRALWAAIRGANAGISDRDLTGKVVTVLARADLGTHNLTFKEDGTLVQVKVTR